MRIRTPSSRGGWPFEHGHAGRDGVGVVLPREGLAQDVRRRLDDQLTRRPVDDHDVAGHDARRRVVQADDGRDLQRTGEDGGVIRAAAGVHRESADARPVDLRGHRRR